MPSNTHPALYERAAFIAASHADDFLKWIDEADCESVTGSVEAPTGFVMLARITSDDIATWVSSQGDPWMSERRNFSPGWYIIRHDDNGLVWGLGYGGECDVHPGELCADTFAEESARADFAEAETVYSTWLDEPVFGEGE